MEPSMKMITRTNRCRAVSRIQELVYSEIEHETPDDEDNEAEKK